MGFNKLRVGSFVERARKRMEDKGKLTVAANSNLGDMPHTLGALSRGLKKLASKVHKNNAALYQHKNTNLSVVPKEPNSPSQLDSDGILNSSSPRAVPLPAPVFDEATALSDEHMMEAATRTHEAIDKPNLEQPDNINATGAIGGLASTSHDTPIDHVRDFLAMSEESCTADPTNIVPDTPIPTGKARGSIITFDKNAPEHVSNRSSSSQNACSLHTVLRFASTLSTIGPTFEETNNLVEKLPYQSSSLTASPCTVDGTEDWIVGTISDLPHRLFHEKSNDRFFSGQTLISSRAVSGCAQQKDAGIHRIVENIDNTSPGHNDTGHSEILKANSVEAPIACEALQNAGDAKDAFTEAWETVLKSRETSHENEIADLKDEYDDQLKDMKKEHAAELEQLKVKIQSEESKKVVLQKRVKKLVDQLATSKEEAKSLAEDSKEEIMAYKFSNDFLLSRNEAIREDGELKAAVKDKESALIGVRKRFQASTQQQNDLWERYEKQNATIQEFEAERGRLSGVISSLQHDLKAYSDGDVYERAKQTIVGLNEKVRHLQQQLSMINEHMKGALRTCAVYKDQARDWENRARRRTQEAERNGEIIDYEQTITSQRKALDDLTKDHSIKAKALIETKQQLELSQYLSDTKATQQDQLIQRQRDARTDLETRFRSLQVSNKTLIENLKAGIAKDTFTTGLSVEFDRMRDDNDFLISHALKQEIMIEEAAKECTSLRIEHVMLEKTLEDEHNKCRKFEESERMLKVQLDSAELRYEMLEGIHERAIVEHNETAKLMAENIQQRYEELDKVFKANTSDQFRWQINQKDALISSLESEVTNALQIAKDYQQELERRQWSDDGDACISGLMERTLEDLRRDVQDAQNERDQANERHVACEYSLRQNLLDLDSSNDQSEMRRQLGVVLRDWAIHLENTLATSGLLNNAEQYMAGRNYIFAMANDLLPEPDEKMKNIINAEVKSTANTCNTEENAVAEGEAGPSNGRITNRNQEAGVISYSFKDSDIF